MRLAGCEHAVGICYCGAGDDDIGTCAGCGIEARLTNDNCVACEVAANLGCQCPKCAPVPVAIEDDRTTPVGHVTDAQLLAEFRAVRS